MHDDTGIAEVIVPDFQLSLAIGKEGQNARLAARLTGWPIDIKSETQLAEGAAHAHQDWAAGEAGGMVGPPAEGGDSVSAEEWSRGEGGPEDQAPAEASAAPAAPPAEPVS